MRFRQLGLSTLGIVLLILVILLLLGVFPVWPHSASFGYGPSGLLMFVLVVVIILLVAGRL